MSIDPAEHAARRNRCMPQRSRRAPSGASPAWGNRPTMSLDDRFDELVDSLAGFQRTWLVYLGVELGLFSRLRAAGGAGLSPEQLAADRGCRPDAIDAWARASDAHRLVTIEDGLVKLDEDTAVVLLDDDRPEFIGGQFVHSVIASLDWGGMLEFFRTGQPIEDRPDRYRASIERLTVQDIAVFFQEALAAAAAARRRPVTRRSRRGHPLRRRPLAHRDGPPVPGPRAGRRRVPAGFRGPGARQHRRGRPRRAHRDPRRRTSTRRVRAPRTTSPTSSTRCTSCPIRSARCARPGTRSDPGAGSSCSTGRCRRRRRTSGRPTAS